MVAWVGAAAHAGRALLGKIGLNAGTLSKAGAWLKNALWGSTFAKATTVVGGASLALGGVGGGESAAQSSEAAQQVRRYQG